MSRVRSTQRVWLMNNYFGPIRGEKIMIFINLKNSPDTSEPFENTHLDLWKNTGPSRASLHVIRRAVVSSNTGAEEICRPNPTHGIGGLGSLLDRFLNYLLSGT